MIWRCVTHHLGALVCHWQHRLLPDDVVRSLVRVHRCIYFTYCAETSRVEKTCRLRVVVSREKNVNREVELWFCMNINLSPSCFIVYIFILNRASDNMLFFDWWRQSATCRVSSVTALSVRNGIFKCLHLDWSIISDRMKESWALRGCCLPPPSV